MREELQQMFRCLDSGPSVYLPSKFWQQLNEDNITQLESAGLKNLKRTLAQNYFTWVVGMRSPLFRHLASLTSWKDWLAVLGGLPSYSHKNGLGLRRFYEFHVFSRMIWLLAERLDTQRLLRQIQEPDFGSPFPLMFRDRLISQDLANSMMELYSITEGSALSADDRFTVCELGAGYGRNAYVFMHVFPKCKYIIVDIPPALFVSQEYLAKVLPDKIIMRFRPFSSFSEVNKEFMEADIAFLLPHQAEQLANKSIDFFVNISSLHEMTMAQIDAYFALIHRVTRGRFYTKQWKTFENTRDGITIKESDYPYRQTWSRLYTRTPPSHPLFFESLFQVA